MTSKSALLRRVGNWKFLASSLWKDNLLPLFLYSALTIAVTWPLASHFNSALPGTWNDVHQSAWIAWHTKEALLGRQSLFHLSLLYYPYGASLLTSVPGPVIGLLALPFWFWGVEGAYNGAMLLGFILTAFFMYRLARAWELSPAPAFFAGLVLLMAPIHLASMMGHYTKAFIGLMPLALMFFHYALDLSRSRRQGIVWSVATAFALLFSALLDGLQLVLSLMAMGILATIALLRSKPETRRSLLRRMLFMILVGAILLGPLMIATINVALDPAIPIGRNFESIQYQPDIVEFLLPTPHARIAGDISSDILASRGITPTIETAVTIPLVVLALSIVALLKSRGRSLEWMIIAVAFVIISMGPVLKILGRWHFTEYGLPVILPYAFVTAIPGMDFMRTPGRFMEMANIALSMTSGIGLSYMLRRYSKRSPLIFAAACLILLVGQWPRSWDSMRLQPIPPFYRELAEDEGSYGVFDLPVKPEPSYPADMYSAFYQIQQITHKKGITMGYLSRTYSTHPVFPCLIPEMKETSDILLNGEPAKCYQNSLRDLSENNYRYVVYHKPSADGISAEASWGDNEALELIKLMYGDAKPVVDDQFTAVYNVPGLEQIALETMIRAGENWYEMEWEEDNSWRWARSPATLEITSGVAQEACLEITPAFMYMPGAENRIGESGLLTLESNLGFEEEIPIKANETSLVPLDLAAGDNEVVLSLESGNFRPGRFIGSDRRLLSFAVREINLETGSNCSE